MDLGFALFFPERLIDFCRCHQRPQDCFHSSVVYVKLQVVLIISSIYFSKLNSSFHVLIILLLSKLNGIISQCSKHNTYTFIKPRGSLISKFLNVKIPNSDLQPPQTYAPIHECIQACKHTHVIHARRYASTHTHVGACMQACKHTLLFTWETRTQDVTRGPRVS